MVWSSCPLANEIRELLSTSDLEAYSSCIKQRKPQCFTPNTCPTGRHSYWLGIEHIIISYCFYAAQMPDTLPLIRRAVDEILRGRASSLVMERN